MSRLADIPIPDELIERARSGEGAAQAAIYGLVGAPVFALIRRVVGNRAAAEDLFQDTMMALFQRLGDFRGEAPLGAWVRQIAVTRCLMYLRSPWHRARLHWEFGEDDASAAPAMLPVTPAASADAVDVERALASLTPVGRAVVWLFEVKPIDGSHVIRILGSYDPGEKITLEVERLHRRISVATTMPAESPMARRGILIRKGAVAARGPMVTVGGMTGCCER